MKSAPDHRLTLPLSAACAPLLIAARIEAVLIPPIPDTRTSRSREPCISWRTSWKKDIGGMWSDYAPAGRQPPTNAANCRYDRNSRQSLCGLHTVPQNAHALRAVGQGIVHQVHQLASRQGATGAFFNGLLATVLATSCTAPVLGIALGYASSLNNGFLLTLFWLMVGLGLATPYLLLSFQPGWLRWLPKPGAWMQRFKVAMGFPMLAAIVWLCSIISVHYGDRTWWMAAFLVFVALAAWIFGEFVQRGSRHRGIAALCAVLLLAAGYVMALEQHLEWRKPLSAVAANNPRARGVAPKGLAWQPWSPQAVAAARAAGRPVVVDFTATWCPNCNIVVKPAFENASVQKKLRETHAVLLVADYSLFPSSITQELQRFQRDGVPMVLVYPKNPDAPPIVLDLPGSGSLVKALDQANRM